MEKRPRFNRNGIFRHFPPWIQVWWQRCEAAGAGGGKKFRRLGRLGRFDCLVNDWSTYPPNVCLFRNKGWKVDQSWVITCPFLKIWVDQTSRSLTKKGYFSQSSWMSSSSSQSNPEDMNLGNLPGNLMAESDISSDIWPVSESFFQGKVCAVFEPASLRPCLRAKLEYDQIYMRNICLTKKTRYVNDYTEKAALSQNITTEK